MDKRKLHKIGNLKQANWYSDQGCKIINVLYEWTEKYGKRIIYCTFDSEDEIYIKCKEIWMERTR